MDVISIAAGAITASISLLLVIGSLWGRIKKTVSGQVYLGLVDAGLIRYRRPGDDTDLEWAGYGNLPEAIEGLHYELQGHIKTPHGHAKPLT